MRQKAVPALQKITDMLTKNDKASGRIEKTFLSMGRTVGTTLVTGIDKAFRWFDKISGDSAFKRLDFIGKLSYMLSSGTAEIVPVAIKAGTQLGFALAKGIVAGVWQAAAEDPKTGATIGLLIPGPWQAKAAAAAGMSLLPWTLKRSKERINEIRSIDPVTGMSTKGWSNAMLEMQKKAKSTPEGQPLTKGATLSAHALGGIFTKPHVGLFAEKGPEGLVPMAANQRRRGLTIWSQIGNQLGVPSGGMQPALTGGRGLSVSIGKVDVNLGGNQIDENALALKIGWQVLNAIKKAFENKV
jgi:hypothetical protein